MKSLSIPLHLGEGSRFDDYAANVRKEFPNVQEVLGIGSKAVFFGFDLAVQSKNDMFVVAMFLSKAPPEKIALASGALQFTDFSGLGFTLDAQASFTATASARRGCCR
jgi:hypothetical protein